MSDYNTIAPYSLSVSCSYDLFIKLWNVDDGYKNFATLRGHEHSISSVRFLPGDNRIASSSRDNTVRLWDVTSTYAIPVLPVPEQLKERMTPCIGIVSRSYTLMTTGSALRYQVMTAGCY